jgi:hypothetical protein
MAFSVLRSQEGRLPVFRFLGTGEAVGVCMIDFDVQARVDCVGEDWMGGTRRGTAEFRAGRIVGRGYGVRDEKLCL